MQNNKEDDNFPITNSKIKKYCNSANQTETPEIFNNEINKSFNNSFFNNHPSEFQISQNLNNLYQNIDNQSNYKIISNNNGNMQKNEENSESEDTLTDSQINEIFLLANQPDYKYINNPFNVTLNYNKVFDENYNYSHSVSFHKINNSFLNQKNFSREELLNNHINKNNVVFNNHKDIQSSDHFNDFNRNSFNKEFLMNSIDNKRYSQSVNLNNRCNLF